jgi:hypothetical protein
MGHETDRKRRPTTCLMEMQHVISFWISRATPRTGFKPAYQCSHSRSRPLRHAVMCIAAPAGPRPEPIRRLVELGLKVKK